jgi:anti-anti-sigma factor
MLANEGSVMSDIQMSQRFQARSVHYGATTFLMLAGEFDIACEDQFEAEFSAACWERPECLVLDLSELSFVDSSGLRSLLLAQQRAAEEGFRLAVLPSHTKAVRQVLRISGLDRLLPLLEEDPAPDEPLAST